jgi:quercetin dioxygenase-like cupin family protein
VPRHATAEEIEQFTYGDPGKFLGRARVHSVSEELGTNQFRIRHVFFEPGARARPHMHGADQLLFFPIGGIVAVDGEPDELVAPGRYVLLPGGHVHMHGAAGGAPAEHISIMSYIDSDFTCPIPESWMQYRAG